MAISPMLTTRLSPALLDELNAEAARRGVDRSTVVREAIENLLSASATMLRHPSTEGPRK